MIVKGVLVGAIFLLVIAGAYFAGISSQHADAEALVRPSGGKGAQVGLEPALLDLGVHEWATEVPLVLDLGNWGRAPVTVQEVTTSCGCLVVDGAQALEGRALEPGDVISVDLILDTQKKLGPQSRTVTVVLSDGATCSATIDLEVVGTWGLSEDSLDFGDIALDEPRLADPAQSVIFSAAPDELRTAPVADAPWIACESARRSGGQTEILVTVRRETLPPGVSRGAVYLRTTSVPVPSGAIFVKARGIQYLKSSPAHVFLRGKTPQALKISSADGRAVILESIVSGDENIKARITNPDTVEVWNQTGEPLAELFIVTAPDEVGRTLRIPVSTF